MENLTDSNKFFSNQSFADQGRSSFPESFSVTLRRIIPLVIAVIGLILMGVGILIKVSKVDQKTSETIQKNDSSLVSGTEFSRKLMLVDVSGAVEQPGVIEIQNDSRIRDVLISAGGLSAKADRTYISKNINLTQRVFDGMKLYFPYEGEDLYKSGDVGNDIAGKDSAVNGTEVATINEKVDLNLSSKRDLEDLPGVGVVTADKIIAGRPYQKVSDLLINKIVGKSVYEKIKDLVSVN